MIARGELIGNGCRDLMGGHIIVPYMRLSDQTIVRLMMSQKGHLQSSASRAIDGRKHTESGRDPA